MALSPSLALQGSEHPVTAARAAALMRSLRHAVALVLFRTGLSDFAAMQLTWLGNQVSRVTEETYRSVLAAENMVKALKRQEQARLTQQAGTGTPAGTFERQRETFHAGLSRPGVAPSYLTEPLLLDSISPACQVYL